MELLPFILIIALFALIGYTIWRKHNSNEETPTNTPSAPSQQISAQERNLISENVELKSRLARAEATEHQLTEKLKNTQQELTLVKRDLAYAKSQEKQYFSERTQLNKRYKVAMSELENKIVQEVSERTHYLEESIKPRPELLSAFYKLCDMQAYQKSIMQGLLQRAFDQQPEILKMDISATIHSCSKDKEYRTTLSSCTCPDHGYRDRPCKHMLYLAYLLGLLQIDQKEYEHVVEEYNDLGVQIAELKEEIKKEQKTYDKLISLNGKVIRAINEAPNSYSRLAGVMADLVLIEFAKSEAYLRIKHPRAKKAHEEIADLRAIAHDATKKYKELEYKMEEIKALFPNIEEILNKDFRIDDFELETCEDKEPAVKQKKDYVSKYLNTEKYLRAKNKEQ